MRDGVRSALSVLLVGAVWSTASSPVAVRAEDAGEAAPPEAVSDPTASVASNSASDAMQPVYVVQQGDTLSALAQRCLGDGNRWHEIHHKNPQVKNPHRIYPGDELLIDCPPTATAAATEVAPAVAPEPEAASVTGEPASAGDDAAGAAKPLVQSGPSATAFRVTESQYAYIAPRRELPVAVIAGNIDGLAHFGQNQRVYLNEGKDSEFQVGDRFSIYRDAELVVHPATGSVLGYMTRILGDLVIEEVAEHSSIGRIMQAFDPIAPGDALAPYIDVNASVSPVDSDRALTGVIVGSPAVDTDLVERRSVFLDKGKNDGVKPGNVVGIYRTGIVTADPVSGHELTLPRELIGKAIVFRVEDATASAWVFSSSRNLRFGDQVSFE